MEREQLMAKYLYGGVTLPAKPDYDETVFPCAYMVGGDTLIVVSAVGPIIKDSGGNATGMRSADGTNLIYSAWTCDDGETWTPLTVERETSTVAAANVFWSNTDLCYEDGTVYVAASEPVPVVEKFPLRQFVEWILPGWGSRPLPMGAREPVAYLYNGVRLPGLPKEWNPETHPYLYIIHAYRFGEEPSEGVEYELLLKKYPLKETSMEYYWESDGPCIYYDNINGKWVFNSSAENEDFDGAKLSYIDWCNVDLIRNEEIYLEASDPVPVYECEVKQYET